MEPALVPVASLAVLSSLAEAQAGRDWPVWGGDAGGTKYSTLQQIDRDNVGDLEVAWIWEPNGIGRCRSRR